MSQPAERLVVEPYDGRYRILDMEGKLLATTARRPEAFDFVRGRGARVRLKWDRTVIGGQSSPGDFSAQHEDHRAGRIYPVVAGFDRAKWAWFMNGTDPDSGRGGSISGRGDTKDEAVVALELAYTSFIADSDKYRPK
ncbi:hypothetical protein EOA37_09760 [Mesorhizobium sp. M2A.F.Ca.ET.015.02.1.1]|uniref:hypothetical protein n=1 Tax=Mesorhizobium sp. M2A.F.Ca.ET.015.02.1.1 TaxID=2496758 RepID=UPI000FCAF7B7|nr:hypothetical protein [Mesorhizobium sp. M2A.F.Ca.ET.015.02.1.1]RUW41536.1 hypothetical protein EOA37_09760 [Mesorhizobium sp. M2A.F.Ca.ET.015.02.1.1]